MRETKKISIAAILSALSVVVLYFGSVFEVLDLSCAAIASIAIIFAQIELKSFYPYLIYATASLLSLLLIPSKFSALLYVLFGGLYPLIKRFAEKYTGAVRFLIKLIAFALIMAIAVLMLVFVFLVQIEELFTPYYLAVLAVCFVTFILYDYALSLMITFYFNRLRKKIQKYLR